MRTVAGNCPMSTTSHVGKAPPVINLDDESDDSENEIELVILEDSFCCKTPNCQSPAEGANKTSSTVDVRATVQNLTESVAGDQPATSKTPQTTLSSRDGECLGNPLSEKLLNIDQRKCKAPNAQLQPRIVKNSGKPKSVKRLFKRRRTRYFNLENSSDIELPTLSKSLELNSNGNGSNKGNTKMEKKKKGQKRKLDPTALIHSDDMHPLKSIKWVATSKPAAVFLPNRKKIKAKKKWKRRRNARGNCETVKGKPFATEDLAVQVQLLTSTNELQFQSADNSVIKLLHEKLEEKSAPLGSCVNPIVISDLPCSQENEKDLEASNKNVSQANRKQIEDSCFEILLETSKNNALGNALLKNNGKKGAASATIPVGAEISQMKPRTEQPCHSTPNAMGNPPNKNAPADVRAGPTFSQLASCVPFTFTSHNLLGMPLHPAPNALNISTGIHLLHPYGAVLQWANKLAEQAELHHRATANATTNGLQQSHKLRPIAIDGSNVAFSHGKDKVFSTKGIKICIDYFLERGHVVKAFVPQFRRKAGYSVQNQPLLEKLGKSQQVVFTPSREINGVNVACYDDRFVLDYAARTGAVIVSNDNYRDLMKENALWKEIVNARLLMYSFADDHFMVPDDPLGRNGPRLHQFLRF